MPRLVTFALLPAILFVLSAATFHPPAGQNYPNRRATAAILPGGGFLQPFGQTIETGPGPQGLALSPRGAIATADVSPERYGITVVRRQPGGIWKQQQLHARTPGSRAPEAADPDWQSVSYGIAFESERSLWISEGISGRVRLVDLETGDHRRIFDLNGGVWKNSFSGDLVYDAATHLLCVLDQANRRVAFLNSRNGRTLFSLALDLAPDWAALSPDRESLWVAGGAGVTRIDITDVAHPVVTGHIATDGVGIAGVLAAGDNLFISNRITDTITVISAAAMKTTARIQLSVPSLENLRGIQPAGMAFDPLTGWLLVAETGTNSVGVIDTKTGELLGEIPAGWRPSRIAIDGDRVYVANLDGAGSEPRLRVPLVALGEAATLRKGSVSTFIMPDAAELSRLTRIAFSLNGFVPDMRDPAPLPEQIRHVVLILKQGRSFDEVLGDIAPPASGPVQAFARFARFGMQGTASGRAGQFSVQRASITPNHHAIAARWAFSDNFYSGFESVFGEPFRQYLERNGVTVRILGGGAGEHAASDQARAAGALDELEKAGAPFPQFLCIRLPGDGLGIPDSAAGFPYEASFMEDNDLALGRVLEYLSHTPAWREMAVFITEQTSDGGLDHIDAHRTPLIAAGPFIKRSFATHINSAGAGLERTILDLLRIPPIGLADATAASLRDLFTADPDYGDYDKLQPDLRIFNPALLKPAAPERD